MAGLHARFGLEINRAAVVATAIMSVQTEMASHSSKAEVDMEFKVINAMLLDDISPRMPPQRRDAVPFRLLSALMQERRTERTSGLFYDASYKGSRPEDVAHELNEIEAYREDHAKYWARDFQRFNGPLYQHIKDVLEPQQSIFPRYTYWPNPAGRPDLERPTPTQEARYLVQQPYVLMNVPTLHIAPSDEGRGVYSFFGVIPMRNRNSISSLIKGVIYNQFYSYRTDTLLEGGQRGNRPRLPFPRTTITRNRIYIPIVVHRLTAQAQGRGVAVRFVGSICLEHTIEGVHAEEHRKPEGGEYSSYGRTTAAIRFSLVGYNFAKNQSDHLLGDMASAYADPFAPGAVFNAEFLSRFGGQLLTSKELNIPLDDEYDESEELVAFVGIDRFFSLFTPLDDGGEYWLQYATYVFAETWLKTINKATGVPAFVEQCAQNHMRADGSIYYGSRLLTHQIEAAEAERRRAARAALGTSEPSPTRSLPSSPFIPSSPGAPIDLF
jgi:hypothetical protein